jgi:4-amino-4-deoxy-L-arabinose transferase-like glycosyltransferase
MLLSMFALMFGSSWDESAIMDEMPHIPAGYSYLTQKDMRINPEHPPLIKDLAAIPLLLLDLKFPADSKYWAEDINGQWAFGAQFLYDSGNDADQILHYARLPLMLLTIITGWMFYVFVARRYGYQTAILALLFYATSPTFIAHGRYVTTDVGATFGFFLGLTAFLKFLEMRGAGGATSRKYLLLAGLAFGVAQLCKFSLFLLVPIYILLGTLWVIVNNWEKYLAFGKWSARLKLFIKEEIKILAQIVAIGLVGVLVISFVYSFHIWNYPPERQLNDMRVTLSSFGFRPLVNFDLWMASVPVLRPLSQYLFGLMMVIQRAAGGNTTYFIGEISRDGWWYYFPLAYLLKEQLALHLLTLWALILGTIAVWRAPERSVTAVVEWMRRNFALVVAIVFISVYWGQSMRSNLNIGVRHILPTFPFIYLLVSRRIVKWLHTYRVVDPQSLGEWLTGVYERYVSSLPRYLALGLFVFWLIVESAFTYPFYLSYYNELAGGPQGGYKYIVDSNYDWGQDLKRLTVFVNEMNIQKIDLDYFGGGSARYYLEGKFEPWWSAKGAPQKGEWFAVSATLLQGSVGHPLPGVVIKPEDSYSWLRGKEPFARAGQSIFIYEF